VDWLAWDNAQTCLTGSSLEGKASSLVGHEPDFSETISAMLGLKDAAALKVRKASLTGVELLDFRAERGQLHFLVPARLM
jgi:phosphohistidine phosphatase SixA